MTDRADHTQHRLTEDWLTEHWLRAVLAQSGAAASGPGVRGDHDLNPDFAMPERLRPAAVLVGLQDSDDGLRIVLTRRASHLAAHAGQISFPGGRCDLTDRDHVETALRESWEEIGLSPDAATPLGRLDTYVTRTGFEVVPVVAWLSPSFDPGIASAEVAEVFSVPVDFILQPGYPKRHTKRADGRDRFYYAFPYRDWYIWGATAGMLVNFRDVVLSQPLAAGASTAPGQGVNSGAPATDGPGSA